jgi:hypothetical protein
MPKINSAQIFYECGHGSFCQILRPCHLHDDIKFDFEQQSIATLKKWIHGLKLSKLWWIKCQSDCKCNDKDADWIPYHPFIYNLKHYIAAYCNKCCTFLRVQHEYIITFC